MSWSKSSQARKRNETEDGGKGLERKGRSIPLYAIGAGGGGAKKEDWGGFFVFLGGLGVGWFWSKERERAFNPKGAADFLKTGRKETSSEWGKRKLFFMGVGTGEKRQN